MKLLSDEMDKKGVSWRYYTDDDTIYKISRGNAIRMLSLELDS